MRRYLALDVGCLECGETTSVVGLYDTKAEADAALHRAAEEQNKNWSGQHDFVMFDLQLILDRQEGNSDRDDD